jgi:hypothetical protein
MDDLAPAPTINAATRQERRSFAARLQAIEANPFDAEDIALFEQFDRKGMSDEQRVAYLKVLARALVTE